MSHSSYHPLIAINCEYKPATPNVPGVSFISDEYSQAVIAAGGIPVLLPPTENVDCIASTLARVDGCILVGGADLDPQKDGFRLHRFVRPMDPVREAFDRLLVKEIYNQRKPVLGIGVGMQLLNVSRGGALFLHISEDIPNAMPHRDNNDRNLRHPLVVEKDSFLEQVYGRNNNNDIRVNSRHHMAVDDVAPGFFVSARCPGDNVIEAIEYENDDWFAIGVQFHPEALSATSLDQRIFSEFIKGVIARNEACLGG